MSVTNESIMPMMRSFARSAISFLMDEGMIITLSDGLVVDSYTSQSKRTKGFCQKSMRHLMHLHQGICAMVEALEAFFYWPTLKRDAYALMWDLIVCQPLIV